MVRDSGQRLRALIACWRQHNDLVQQILQMEEDREGAVAWLSYADVPEEEREDTCPITRTEFEEDSPIAMLPCGHYFHRGACSEWLEQNSTCPVCRRPVAQNETTQTVRNPGISITLVPMNRNVPAPNERAMSPANNGEEA